MGQSRDEFGGRRIGQIKRRCRRLALGLQAVDATVLPVTQRIFVGVAFSHDRLESRGLFRGPGIVLNDEIIPIGYPQIPIGAHIREHR